MSFHFVVDLSVHILLSTTFLIMVMEGPGVHLGHTQFTHTLTPAINLMFMFLDGGIKRKKQKPSQVISKFLASTCDG